MGFLSEIKKLLFVKKAVAKSGAEKAVDFGLEKGKDVVDKSSELLKDTGEILVDKTSGLRDAVIEKGGDAFDSLKDTASSTIDTVKESDILDKAGDAVGGIGEKVVAAGSSLVGKAKDVVGDVVDSDAVKGAAEFTENVGDKVLDTGESFMEKAKEVSGPIGEKLGDIKDNVVERAQEVTGDLKEKLDETIVKAEAMAEEERLNPPKEFADDTVDAGGSLLDGTDDFFSKADQYADGDYGAFSEGKVKISDERIEIDKSNKPDIKAAGFQDLDGDGDEIIDDALILEDLPEDDPET